MKKGIICIFTGYTKQYGQDCYYMQCEMRNKYYLTRDAVFLHQICFEKLINKSKILVEPLKITVMEEYDPIE